MTDPQPTHDIEAVFREKGIPFTRQRRLIWEFFAGADRAATIAEAADALRGDGVGQATVYRTVTLLSDLGLLARVQDRRGEICYTAPPIGHSHPLICGVCRRVVRFDGDGDVTRARGAARRRDRASRSTAIISRCTASAPSAGRPGRATMASDASRAGVPSANGRPTARRSPPDLVTGRRERRPGRRRRRLAGRRFFCSWSGGKDAYLALQRAVAAGGRPGGAALHAARGRPRQPRPRPAAGAARGGRPRRSACRSSPGPPPGTTTRPPSSPSLHELRGQGVEAGVFGDIDLRGAPRLGRGGLRGRRPVCHLPLWQEPRRAAARRAARGRRAGHHRRRRRRPLDAEFLGRELDAGLIADLEAAGADACGEEGEYHTMVTAAPLFSAPVPLGWDGARGARRPLGPGRSLRVAPIRRSHVTKGVTTAMSTTRFAPPHRGTPSSLALLALGVARPGRLRLERRRPPPRARRPPPPRPAPSPSPTTPAAGHARPAGRPHREPGAGQHRDRLRHRRRRQDGGRHELRRLPRGGQEPAQDRRLRQPERREDRLVRARSRAGRRRHPGRACAASSRSSACRSTWSTPRPTTASIADHRRTSASSPDVRRGRPRSPTR